MFKEQLMKYKDDFANCKNDLKNIKTWYKQIPNLLTISRPLGMIPANILFFTGNVVPAVILTGCLLLTDLFDGKLARKWDVQSKLGADLDAVGDKVMFLGLALPIVVSNPLMLINILLEGTISYINVMGRLKGMDTKTVYSGKIKTWFLSLLLLMGYVANFVTIPKLVLDVIMAVTCVSQGVTLKDYINEYKKMEQQQQEESMNKYIEMIEKEKNDSKTSRLVDKLISERDFLLSIERKYDLIKPKKKVLIKERKINTK